MLNIKFSEMLISLIILSTFLVVDQLFECMELLTLSGSLLISKTALLFKLLSMT